jgi:uncharacterized Zn-binding protein involved in type VI secretion
MGMPAARVGDMTAHGSPLGGAPGFPTVLIGGRPAWRGISAAAAANLAATVVDVAQDIAKAALAATAAAGTPAGPAAQVNLGKTAVEGVGKVAAAMAGLGGDMHACPLVKVVIPDGPGLVTVCSQTVLIGGQGAARQGDPIQEATNVNSIAAGEPTVMIGG